MAALPLKERSARHSAEKKIHPRHADMKDDIQATHAMRLGFRQVSGLSEEDGLILEARRGRGYDSIRDLWLRTGLIACCSGTARARRCFPLAWPVAPRCLLGHPRAAAIGRQGRPAALRAGRPMREIEPDVDLPPMLPGEQVVEDYRHLKLSLRAHPVSFLRADLASARHRPQ